MLRSLNQVHLPTVLLGFILPLMSATVAVGATEKTLHNFSTFPDGVNPDSALIQDAAGNSYGYAQGGAYGVIFKLSRDKIGAWTETVIHDFTGGSDGATPVGALSIDAKGNIYGATSGGGTYSSGVVFELLPSGATWKETILHTFSVAYTDGYTPTGVVMDSAGNLYGTTEYGGNSQCYDDDDSWIGCGIVFELSPQFNGTWVESVLYNFQGGTDGGLPQSPPALDHAGNVFGTTFSGGTISCYEYYCGVLFEVSKQSNGTWAESVPFDFGGDYVSGNAIAFDGHGNLYEFDYGVVQFVPSSSGPWTANVISDVEADPNGTPVFDSAGNLYGTITFSGNGSIFKLTPTTSGYWTDTTVYTFAGGSDGADPSTPLVSARGNIYVAAKSGGEICSASAYGHCGTIFEASPNSTGGWTGSTLYEFAPGPVDGLYPDAGLVVDSLGNFYGTTEFGGTSNKGTVFEVSPGQNGAWTSTVLYSFTGLNGDGSEPTDKLAFDSEGNLYGTTTQGGSNTYCQGGESIGCGTVFKLSPSADGTWIETVLYTFNNASGSTDGSFPSAGVTLDSEGNVYGTTVSGGTSYCGTVFKLTASSRVPWTETLLYNFPTCGGQGVSGLVFDAQGNLYGTTNYSIGEYGSVYKLSPPSGSGTSWIETTLYGFSNFADGAYPRGGVVFDSDGNIYGTTWFGGAYETGTVFKLTPNSTGPWTETLLHSFKGADGDGASPASNVILDSSGNIYGTTLGGGNSNCICGTVFELTPAGRGYRESILFSFSAGLNGSQPYSALLLDSGNLYGTTSAGGAGAAGVVFEVTP
jgi:uncharacterized repeat protein (TIGR03803 family)